MHAGGEQGENRQSQQSGKRLELVRISFGARCVFTVHHTCRGQQTNQYTGQRGMDAGFKHHDPGKDADHAHRDPWHFLKTNQMCPYHGTHGDANEPVPSIDRGEEHRYQDDGQQIVDRGQSHQECADRTGQRLGKQCEHRQRERDIRGCGHRPAVGHLGERDAAASGGQDQ